MEVKTPADRVLAVEELLRERLVHDRNAAFFLVFILADLVATLMYIGLFVGAGWLAGQHGVDVAQTISRYGGWIALAVGLLTIGYMARLMRGAWREMKAAEEIAEEIAETD